jgi:hypothetical protein
VKSGANDRNSGLAPQDVNHSSPLAKATTRAITKYGVLSPRVGATEKESIYLPKLRARQGSPDPCLYGKIGASDGDLVISL